MTENALAALHVLVTRPEPQQQELVAAITAAGGQALHLPLIAIRPLSPQDDTAALVEIIQNLDHYQLLIFVSANAVLHGVEWIDRYWPQFPVGIDLVAIGPNTARALTAELGCKVHYAETGITTEDLLQLPVFADVADKRIGIVRGRGGRELMAQSLRDRGARVDYLEVYERQQLPYVAAEFVATLQANAINVLTVTSAESLQYLAALLGDNKAQMSLLPLLVPSARVAQQARNLGFAHVVNSGGADVASMMAALAHVARRVLA